MERRSTTRAWGIALVVCGFLSIPLTVSAVSRTNLPGSDTVAYAIGAALWPVGLIGVGVFLIIRGDRPKRPPGPPPTLPPPDPRTEDRFRPGNPP